MLAETQQRAEDRAETGNKEQVLQFAPSTREVGASSMKIGVAKSYPVTEVEVKGPPLPVFMNGAGFDASNTLSFSTPVAPLIKDQFPGSLLPQTPPCPEMKEILPANLATCTLPAAVYPCKQLGISAPVRFSAPTLPLPLENREIQSPGLHFIFNVDCFTLPGSSM
jgi:hypothetical protein